MAMLSHDLGIREVMTEGGPVLMPPTNLPESDGEPLESHWHVLAIMLLVESLSQHWRDRNDFFAGANMFVYYSTQQVQLLFEDLELGTKRAYRGPDFFVVKGVDRFRPRRFWAAWDEGGKYPDVIVELLSPSTARKDRTVKKEVYERILKTSEYFLYDPESNRLEAWRLGAAGYEPIHPDERGWVWSAQLELWLGPWQGEFLRVPGAYPRFRDPEGNLVLTGSEAEKQRADTAEAELARLKVKLAEIEGRNNPAF